MKKIFTLLFSAACLTGSAQTAFQPTSIVVYRTGEGTAPLRGVSTQVFLDEYSPTGTLIRSLPMPTTQSGTNAPLTGAGTSTTEGLMTRSADTRYLVFGGYAVDTGVASPTSSSSTLVKRVIGRVDAAGNINTSTVLNTAFSGGTIRGVASTDGVNIWMSGSNSGVRHTTIGDTASTRVNAIGVGTVSNFRSVNIFNGQLYATTSSGSFRMVSIGTGTPMDTGNAIMQLPGIPTTGGPNQFFFADINTALPGPDVLYIANDTATAGGGGIQKYSFNGTSWVSNDVSTPPATPARGITGIESGGIVTLYVTSGNKLYSFIDASGYNNNIAGTYVELASAATNTAFRGVALAPQMDIAPLKLVSFKGSLSTEGSNLVWLSSNEVSMRNFTVERSKDGVTYSAIGIVEAKNRNEASYSFIDRAPFAKANYYRLKMTSVDGSSVYSNIVTLSNSRSIKAEVFPNPAFNNLTVSHSKASKGATLIVTDASGKQVKTLTIAAGAIQTNVALDRLTKGNYVVTFNNDGEKSAVKFMKQ